MSAPARRGPAPPAPDLVRLVYVSAAAPGLAPADLAAIEAASLRHNAARGLTGLLLFGGGRFYGVLEGPGRRLFARMERIAVDPRHRNLRILREDAACERRFANWSFARISDDGDRRDAPPGLDDFLLGMVGRL
jgi:hypothetical protein